MKKLWFLLLTVSLLVIGCGHESPKDSGGADLDAATLPDLDVSLPDLADTEDLGSDLADLNAEPDAEIAQWTIMIYINGDNNLSPEVPDDLEELSAAEWSSDVRVVVLADTYFGQAIEMILGPFGFDHLDLPGELDMADWTVLRDFALRSVEAFPAKHYALVIWNHGNGWEKPSAPDRKGISGDWNGAAGIISVADGELTAALSPVAEALGRPLDLLGMDACLMGMWEVAVAVEGVAEVFVASQENEPFSGWEYTGVLTTLAAEPDMDAGALASAIVTAYHDADDKNATLSAVALDKLPAVTDAINALGEALLALPEHWDAVETARTGVMQTSW